MDYGGYSIFKGKARGKILKNVPDMATGFMARKDLLGSVVDFNNKISRVSTLTIKAGNERYTLINAHAPINEGKRKNLEKVEEFWGNMERVMGRIPRDNIKILSGDHNAQVGKEKK